MNPGHCPIPWYDRRSWYGPLIVAAAILVAYYNSFSGVFLFDDEGPSSTAPPSTTFPLPFVNSPATLAP